MLLHRLDLEKIYGLSPFFSISPDGHWEYIGDKHTLAFDFSRIEEIKRQAVFAILFSTKGDVCSKAARFLPRLGLERIYTLSPFFSDHWAYIGDKHTLAFDFSRIEETKRQAAFAILFSTKGDDYSKAAQLLPKLPPDQQAIIHPYLLPKAQKYLEKIEKAKI